MITSNQMKWAASHDWFVADLGDGRALVREDWMQVEDRTNLPAGTSGSDWLTFLDFRELRNWAGY